MPFLNVLDRKAIAISTFSPPSCFSSRAFQACPGTLDLAIDLQPKRKRKLSFVGPLFTGFRRPRSALVLR